MSKKDKVIETVFAQAQPFYSSTITSLSGTSVALVSNTLNGLISEGKLTSRKEGKKLVYTVIDGYTNTETTITREPICTVEERFEYIRGIVRMVIDGVNPSAMITGRAGVGKTHLVRDELEKAGLKKDRDYLFVTGHSLGFGLYKLLHDHRDCFVVFDDCDSALKDPKAIGVLKGALDSYDERRVSWFTDKTNNKDDIDPFFDFEGRCIFISNMYADQIDDALCSRSFCMDLHMSNDEVTEHMSNLLDKIETDVPLNIKKEVLEFISPISTSFKAYGLRTLIQSIRIRTGYTGSGDWKTMIKTMAQGMK